MIYKSSGKGKVKASQGYAAQKNQWERQISQRKEVVNNARKGVVQGSGWGLKNTFTARELAQANRFAAHLNGSGDLFRQEGLTAKNEELMGLLAAVTAMKGQVYATEAGQGKAITFPLQSAIDRMIDHYLRQKAAASVYYHTISIFEKTKNPQKAVEAGFEFAYKQFQEKQDTPAFQTQSQYAEQAGFFQAFLKNQPIEKELSSGLRILEENWRDFLRAIGKERDHAFTLRLQKQSPWEVLLSLKNIGQKKRLMWKKFCWPHLLSWLSSPPSILCCGCKLPAAIFVQDSKNTHEESLPGPKRPKRSLQCQRKTKPQGFELSQYAA